MKPPSKAEVALTRNAVAAEQPPPRPSPLAARQLSRALSLPEPTAEERAEYEYELTEAAGRYMDAGCSEAEADRLAFDDLGHVQFWLELRGRRGQYPPLRRRTLRLVPPTGPFCARCESVGHAVARCPFPADDKDMLRVARLRRERRAGKEAVA